jgi:hypothetical protein
MGGNGEWGMGKWGMGNGEWGNGEWGMGNGEWGMARSVTAFARHPSASWDPF